MTYSIIYIKKSNSNNDNSMILHCQSRTFLFKMPNKFCIRCKKSDKAQHLNLNTMTTIYLIIIHREKPQRLNIEYSHITARVF